MPLLSAIQDSPEARRVEPGWLKSEHNSSMFRPRRGQLQGWLKSEKTEHGDSPEWPKVKEVVSCRYKRFFQKNTGQLDRSGVSSCHSH